MDRGVRSIWSVAMRRCSITVSREAFCGNDILMSLHIVLSSSSDNLVTFLRIPSVLGNDRAVPRPPAPAGVLAAPACAARSCSGIDVAGGIGGVGGRTSSSTNDTRRGDDSDGVWNCSDDGVTGSLGDVGDT